MSNLLQLFQGNKSYGPKRLFKNAAFSLNAGEHVGVIGPNGAGKTTLFKVLTGQESLDSGELIRSKGLRIGYLAQHDSWSEGQTIEDYLSQGCSVPIWELKALGNGLGLSEADYAKPIASLSGGYRMRCKLLHLLGEEPDVLLLDEPTNYLDLESLLVLEKFLKNYSKAFLLISHDREFLQQTTDHILEVEEGEITKYPGKLEAYFAYKEQKRIQLEARAESLEEKRQEVLDFVARFGAKASKASQAQSRLKSLDRMETIELKTTPKTARIPLPAPTPTGKQILNVEGVDLGYGERVVLKDIRFVLNRGDHLAVVGVNGAGKSTFLKAISGRLTPLKGTIKHGHNVTLGYYAQHVSEALNPSHTVFQAMGALAHPDITPQQIANLAGALLFSGDDVQKPISVLSGGEKSRVALGQILLARAPCLVLDEPTNHLDFQTVDALTEALRQYPGSVVIVSHDRSFIRRVSSQILEIRDGRADYYPGTYDEYLWSCTHGGLSARALRPKETPHATKPAAPSSAVSKPNPKPNDSKPHSKDEKKALERELRKLEREQSELEEKLEWTQVQMKTLNDRLSQTPDHPSAPEWISELSALQASVDEAEQKWLAHGERKEALLTQMNSRG